MTKGNILPISICVFGDSHSHHILPKAGSMSDRIGINRKYFSIVGQAIPAASIAGFRPKASTLKTKEIIRAALPNVKHLVLGFGQVDLELGYYYRKVVKNDTDLTPGEYVDWLSGIYLEFIKSLNFPGDHLAIKGCHLTVLSHRNFTRKYVQRIIKTGDSSEEDVELFSSRLDSHILGERQMNKMLMDFNERMRLESQAGLFRYFDINNAVGYQKTPSSPRSLKPQFAPAIFDHHLADSLGLRRIYARSLLRVFDLPYEHYMRN
ncbi:hypothetical protein ACFSDD_23645 [Salipiger marinus]|uniref:Uncharacterized protein n=1 Tax=Salipiger marinus TaxID=555512 RepID=A0A1G8TRQ7_9RHOB|nr:MULTISPECIES: hypothetical protein [Salipiger]MEB3421088.1 hypothetical protein [Salipiger manganoxidans]SDJ44286.1 hypothetical protein SAMN04487993_10322 [Salipiger marinus]